MKKKRISLATQYTFNALIVSMILTTYIVSREGFGFKQYEPIISKFYYMGLILYGLIGLIILTIIMGAPMYKKLNITRVGVRRETIVHLENEKYNPSLKLAMDIAKIFGVTVEDLFKFVD